MSLDNERWMHAAIAEAAKCPSGVPRVGAVVVRDGRLLASGHRDTMHAEQAALAHAAVEGIDVRGATVYTTLEPCSTLRGERTPCAQRLVDARVAEVFVGSYDRNPTIYRMGWKRLIEAGIRVRDFSPDARATATELNSVFDGRFTEGVGRAAGAKFDFMQNGGKFVIYADADKQESVMTEWTARGSTSVYAYAGVPGVVALARYATAFDQIDDPDALDYEATSVGADVGEIVIFRTPRLHALIKIGAVEGGPERGTRSTSLKINWELRDRVQV